MKKFLTVLLALSVVFTYTVGTAFAADATDANNKEYTSTEVETKLYSVISGYEKDMTGNIDRVVDYLIEKDNIDNESDYEIIVKKEAYKEAATEYIKELVGKMEEIANKEVIEADKDGYDNGKLESAAEAIKNVVIRDDTFRYVKATIDKKPDTVNSYVTKEDGGNILRPAVGYAKQDVVYYEPLEVDGKDASTISVWVYAWDKNMSVYKHVTGNFTSGVTYYYINNGQPVSLNLGFNFDDEANAGKYFTDEKGETSATGYADPNETYYVKEAVKGFDLTHYDNFGDDLENTIYITKAEAPKAYEFYLTQIEKNYPLSDYPEEGNYPVGDNTGLNAQQAIDALKAEAVEKIEAAKTNLEKSSKPTKADYETAIKAYEAAYTDLETEAKKIKNNEELEDNKTAVEVALDAEIAALRAYALGEYRNGVIGNIETPQGTNTAKLSTVAAKYKNSDIYDEDASTLFGVKVKNMDKATRAEVLAVKSAFNKAMNSTVDTVKKAVEAQDCKDANAVIAAVKGYYYDKPLDVENGKADESVFTETVIKAYKVSDAYAAVVARGEAMKKAMWLGKKLYDDAKVDEVVKAAEAYVYADMGIRSVDAYFVDAINEVFNPSPAYTSYDKAVAELLLVGDFEYDKLLAAIKDATNKFKDTVVTFGPNATPEADKVFCGNYYAAGVKNADGKTYGDIKTEALEALESAQSYADIEAALTAAKAELAGLLLAADKTDVEAAREVYIKALAEHKNEVAEIKEISVNDQRLVDAETAGKKLINNAITVDAVKAAYADAKALFDDMKTIEELDAMKDAVEKQLKELPLGSAVTEADAAAIEAARAAYDAYMDEYGAKAVSLTAKNKLVAAEKALYTLERDAINAESKALTEKLNAIDFTSADVAVTELVALKAELTAVAAKIDAFNDKMTDLDYDDLAADELKKFNDTMKNVWGAEVYLTEVAILKVLNNKGVDMADVNAAFDAYNALTDRQQYKVDKDTNYAISMIKAKMINSVEAMKVVKAHSTAGKGYIKVMWDVVGNETAIDGFQVYKSTKAQSGYTFMGKTTKHYMTNKKGLKKGKRFYYKVRAYKVIDGTKYFSDWSNKANRIAK